MTFDKKSLRSHYRQARGALDAKEAERLSHDITRHALDAIPGHAKAVAGYAAMNGEAPVWEILAHLAELGVATALPRIAETSAPLAFHLWEPGDALIAGPHGSREPERSAPAVMPDVLLVPLLAFTRDGARLGYGGGYYDRTIAALSEHSPLLIGIAYSLQEAPRLPHEPHDAHLHLIVTEKDIIRASR